MATKQMHMRSADEILQLPVPDGIAGYELVDGELVEVMPVGGLHGDLGAELARRLGNHLNQHRGLGRAYVEAGYVLGLARDPERLRGPDVSFVSSAKLGHLGANPPVGFFRLAPDLAIEVVSPEKPKQLQQRIHDYLDAGTRLVWVIHALTRSATVYRADGSARLLRDSDALDGEDVLPGFVVPLRELFEF